MIEHAHVDEAILDCVEVRRKKVALVIVQADEMLVATGAPRTTVEQIADRLAVLVAQGRFEAFGNVENWRHSEVCLLNGVSAER